MSDPWSRPTDDGEAPPPDHVLEIELDGPGGAVDRSPDAPPADQPNWRKVVAVSSIAGLALGAIVAAVIVSSGDDDSDDDSSRPGADESAYETAITTPETLPPVVVDTTDVAPVISGRPDLPLELPPYEDALIPTDRLGDFVLDAELIGAQPADRVEIEVTNEDGLGATTAVIEYDADEDRYLATFDQRGPVQRLLIDVSSDTLYVMNGARSSGQWEVPEWDVLADDGAAEIYRNLLLSPIRPGTLSSAAISAGMGVILESGVTARRFRVAMPAVAIPEWTSGSEQATPGASHVLEAYVDEDGRLAVVQGTVVVDGNRQLIVYRFDHDADVTIDLPHVDSAAAVPGRRITEGT